MGDFARLFSSQTPARSEDLAAQGLTSGLCGTGQRQQGTILLAVPCRGEGTIRNLENLFEKQANNED